MSSIAFTGAIMVFLLVCIAGGLLRGLQKARLRAILILFCAVGAVVLTFLCRNIILTESFFRETVLPELQKFMSTETFEEYLGISPVVNQALFACIGAFSAPFLCIVMFLVLSVVTWIIYAIVSLILHSYFKRKNSESHFKFARVIVWSVVYFFIVLSVYLIPVTVYTDMLPDSMVEMENAGVFEGALTTDQVTMVIDTAEDTANNPFVLAFRNCGGDALCDKLTSFKVGETDTKVRDEFGAMVDILCTGFELGQTGDLAEYGPEEAEKIRSLSDSFDRSVLLPTVAGEFVYHATDAWSRGEAFLGVEKPSLGDDDSAEILTPFFDKLLEVLHDDAKDYKALQKDVATVADLISVLAEKRVFANLGGDIAALMSSLGGDGTVNSMINILGENATMKALIPEITNMGIRAIATTIGIPADTAAVYGEFLDEIASSLNEVRLLSDGEQIEGLSDRLEHAFNEAGISIDPQIIDCYSASMIEDLVKSDKTALGAEDVQAFFSLFALGSAEAKPNDDGNVALEGILPTDSDESALKGTVYENKTEEELAKSGAAVLADVSLKLSEMEEGGNLAEQAKGILKGAYNDLLSSNPEALKRIENVVIEKKIDKKAIEVTAALQSSDEMITTKVTLDQLLIDVKDAAKNINSETIGKEAEAISSIINAASDLIGSTDDLDLEKVSGAVGGILNSLSGSATVGNEKTADLFTAILQSDTVRETAGIDLATATKIANAATESKNGEPVDYAKTMSAVSGSVSVMTKLGDGEEIDEEELIELIRNITPQTAGMIEAYVTDDRMIGFGVPEEYAATSTTLVTETFSYLANDTSEQDFDKEAKALNNLLSIAMSAKDDHSEKILFSNAREKGILPSAEETVATLMDSRATMHALTLTLTTKEGSLNCDPYGLSEKIPAGSAERKELTDALNQYHTDHPEASTADLRVLSATFMDEPMTF